MTRDGTGATGANSRAAAAYTAAGVVITRTRRPSTSANRSAT